MELCLNEQRSDEQAVYLPKIEDLAAELCVVNKKYDSAGRLQLEEKDEIKKRLGRSPDMADALALTFAEPVYDRGADFYNQMPDNCIESLFRVKKQDSSW